MRKLAVVALAAIFAVSAVSYAEAAKKKSKKGKPAAAKVVDPNEPGRRLVANGIGQIFVPIQSIVAQK